MVYFIIRATFIVSLLVIIFAIWQHFELKNFRITTYHVNAPARLNIAILSDLHERQFGRANCKLLDAVRSINPNIICIPGDLITAHSSAEYEHMIHGDLAKAVINELEFLKQLTEIAPVYYSPGNHEARMGEEPGIRRDIYNYYKDKMQQIGVHYLSNTSEMIHIDDKSLLITGLDIELEYYVKLKMVHMDDGYVTKLLGERPAETDYEILLAHNPNYFAAYKAYGAELTFSGHMHGGLVRIPGIGAVISPQLRLFPRYDAGKFDENGKTMIVSKGLGTHTFNIRVFNRAEVLNIVLGE